MLLSTLILACLSSILGSAFETIRAVSPKVLKGLAPPPGVQNITVAATLEALDLSKSSTNKTIAAFLKHVVAINTHLLDVANETLPSSLNHLESRGNHAKVLLKRGGEILPDNMFDPTCYSQNTAGPDGTAYDYREWIRQAFQDAETLINGFTSMLDAPSPTMPFCNASFQRFMKAKTSTWANDEPKSPVDGYGPLEAAYRREIEALESGLSTAIRNVGWISVSCHREFFRDGVDLCLPDTEAVTIDTERIINFCPQYLDAPLRSLPEIEKYLDKVGVSGCDFRNFNNGGRLVAHEFLHSVEVTQLSVSEVVREDMTIGTGRYQQKAYGWQKTGEMSGRSAAQRDVAKLNADSWAWLLTAYYFAGNTFGSTTCPDVETIFAKSRSNARANKPPAWPANLFP
ncbi:hypothetical protein B0O99DRAFT_600124 [Bisporella sp. PMI_857]|nr:hypothetical protein B0O99DRAFT_600124 [Bisporella sp. PMI_857]